MDYLPSDSSTSGGNGESKNRPLTPMASILPMVNEDVGAQLLSRYQNLRGQQFGLSRPLRLTPSLAYIQEVLGKVENLMKRYQEKKDLAVRRSSEQATILKKVYSCHVFTIRKIPFFHK